MTPRRLRTMVTLGVLAAAGGACNLIAGLDGEFVVVAQTDGARPVDGDGDDDDDRGSDGPVRTEDGGADGSPADGSPADGSPADGSPADGSPADASSTDAPVDAFVPDAATGNLLSNPDFQQGCDNGDWSYNSASSTEVTTARSPTKACRVCAQSGAGGGWAFYQILQLSTVNGVAVGRRFDGEAWVLKPEAGTGGPVHCRVEVFNQGHTKSLQVKDGPQISTLSTVWQKCTASLMLNSAAIDAGVTIETVVIGDVGNACFVVDDVSLKLVTP